WRSRSSHPDGPISRPSSTKRASTTRTSTDRRSTFAIPTARDLSSSAIPWARCTVRRFSKCKIKTQARCYVCIDLGPGGMMRGMNDRAGWKKEVRPGVCHVRVTIAYRKGKQISKRATVHGKARDADQKIAELHAQYGLPKRIESGTQTNLT